MISDIASIKTDDGDIVIQSDSSFRAIISSWNKYYCIASPYFNISSDGCYSDLDVPFPCIIDISLCNDKQCNELRRPIFNIEGRRGNIYANIISGDGIPVKSTENLKVYYYRPEKIDDQKTPYSSDSIVFSNHSQELFDLSLKEYNNREKKDSVMMLNIGNNNFQAFLSKFNFLFASCV